MSLEDMRAVTSETVINNIEETIPRQRTGRHENLSPKILNYSALGSVGYLGVSGPNGTPVQMPEYLNLANRHTLED